MFSINYIRHWYVITYHINTSHISFILERNKDIRTANQVEKNSTSPINISRLSHPGGGYLASCFYCCMNNNGVCETTRQIAGADISVKLLPRVGVGCTWVNFCWVCAAGLSEPLPNNSLLCGRL